MKTAEAIDAQVRSSNGSNGSLIENIIARKCVWWIIIAFRVHPGKPENNSALS